MSLQQHSGDRGRHSDEQYLRFDPFPDEKGGTDYGFRRFDLVTTRAAHECAVGWLNETPHQIPIGTRCLKETAQFDGKVQSTWSCLVCLDDYAANDGFCCFICGEDHR